MTRNQERAARLIGRGRLNYRETAAACGVAIRTVESWASPTHGVPGFRALVEQYREENPTPGADDVLDQAMSACRKDGSPDWPVRVAAARARKLQPPDPSVADGPNAGGGLVVMNVQAYEQADGTLSLLPPGYDVDAEPEEEDDEPRLSLGPGIPGLPST